MPVIKRTLERTMPNGDFVVAFCELRIAEKGERVVNGNFSVTGELYERRSNARGATRKRQGREPDLFGCIHDELLRAFPRLRPLIDLHLSDPDGVPMHGVPMHALANAWYYYCGSRADLTPTAHTLGGLARYRLPINGWTPGLGDDWRIREAGFAEDWRAYAYHVACKMLRVDAIELDTDGWRGAFWPLVVKAQFAEFVNAQRPRWQREAAAARDLLESL